MGEISLYLSTGILAVSGILTVLGLVLKYRTGTSNEIICLVIFVTSVVTWSLIGLVQQLIVELVDLIQGHLPVLIGLQLKSTVQAAGTSDCPWLSSLYAMPLLSSIRRT